MLYLPPKNPIGIALNEKLLSSITLDFLVVALGEGSPGAYFQESTL